MAALILWLKDFSNKPATNKNNVGNNKSQYRNDQYPPVDLIKQNLINCLSPLEGFLY